MQRRYNCKATERVVLPEGFDRNNQKDTNYDKKKFNSCRYYLHGSPHKQWLIFQADMQKIKWLLRLDRFRVEFFQINLLFIASNWASCSSDSNEN